MNQTYGTDGDGRAYISGLPSPMRKDYKKPIMLEREILTSLNEVKFQKGTVFALIIQIIGELSL